MSEKNTVTTFFSPPQLQAVLVLEDAVHHALGDVLGEGPLDDFLFPQGPGHVVEGVGQLPELVPPLDVDLLVEVPRRDGHYTVDQKVDGLDHDRHKYGHEEDAQEEHHDGGQDDGHGHITHRLGDGVLVHADMDFPELNDDGLPGDFLSGEDGRGDIVNSPTVLGPAGLGKGDVFLRISHGLKARRKHFGRSLVDVRNVIDGYDLVVLVNDQGVFHVT
jgi:hypothetical protein